VRCLQALREGLPYDAIHVQEGVFEGKRKAVIDFDKCTICGACVEACKKYGAIVISRKTFDGGDITRYSGVSFYVEHHGGKLASVVRRSSTPAWGSRPRSASLSSASSWART